MPTANINILAVLVAAALTFVLGMVWYSPALFARQWMAAQGYTPEKLEEMKRKGMTRVYAVSVLCSLVTAYVVALLASYTIGLTANLFSEKPLAAWVIDAGYQLAYLMLMGALLSLWR